MIDIHQKDLHDKKDDPSHLQYLYHARDSEIE